MLRVLLSMVLTTGIICIWYSCKGNVLSTRGKTRDMLSASLKISGSTLSIFILSLLSSQFSSIQLLYGKHSRLDEFHR